MSRIHIIVMSLLLCASSSFAAGPEIESRTATMQHMRGFMPLHWDARKGRLYLEIPHLNVDFLYFNSLPYGVGSNDLGLDRGQISEPRIVRFERVGARILLVQPNQFFRSSAADPAERLALRQSFPESVLAGFSVEAQDADGAVCILNRGVPGRNDARARSARAGPERHPQRRSHVRGHRSQR